MTTLTRGRSLKVEATGPRIKKHATTPIIAAPARSAKAQQDKAIEAAFGLLKGKNILPLDALQFERQMRDE